MSKTNSTAAEPTYYLADDLRNIYILSNGFYYEQSLHDSAIQIRAGHCAMTCIRIVAVSTEISKAHYKTLYEGHNKLHQKTLDAITVLREITSA